MFYRKDILAEIGLEVPRTWDEVQVAMTVLSKNQMEFGMLPGDQVYAMLLYQNGDHGAEPVLDENGSARILRLDAGNGWTSFFRVALPHKDADPKALGFFVREVQSVSTLDTGGTPAILENDRTTVLYFQGTAEPEDVFHIGSGYYRVTYQPMADTGGWIVTNQTAVVLPATGGHGTHLYTFSGLLLIAAALYLIFTYRKMPFLTKKKKIIKTVISVALIEKFVNLLIFLKLIFLRV